MLPVVKQYLATLFITLYPIIHISKKWKTVLVVQYGIVQHCDEHLPSKFAGSICV